MKNAAILFFIFLIYLPSTARGDVAWPEKSRALLEQLISPEARAEAAKLSPLFVPTADGRSFALVWYSGETPPKKWLVSLHGTGGNVVDDFMIWQKSLAGRDIGYIALQWWFGEKDGRYYTPQEIYAELDGVMSSLHIGTGDAMLEGFSRGSSNVYAVAAIDHVKEKRYFSAIMANSGGAMKDYPPTRSVMNGAYGEKPFDGLNWMTSCGMRDRRPERDGCPAMQRTAEWLEKMGGHVMLKIEDPAEGHGALNRNPENAKKMLDQFEVIP